jgi:hypothetical protein
MKPRGGRDLHLDLLHLGRLALPDGQLRPAGGQPAQHDDSVMADPNVQTYWSLLSAIAAQHLL